MRVKIKLVLFASLICILVACGIGVFLFFGNNTKKSQAQAFPSAQSVLRKALASGPKSAEPYIDQLQQLSSESTSNDSKASYELAEARVALYVGDYTKARDAGLQSEDLKSSADTAALLGYIYEAMGDKTNAIKYFQLAVSRSPKVAPGQRAAANEYQGEISNLETQK